MSRSGHSDKPKRSSLKKSKDLGVAAARILALLRASPTHPPSEHDLASELHQNIKSARAALAVAKVILPNWTLLWVLAEDRRAISGDSCRHARQAAVTASGRFL